MITALIVSIVIFTTYLLVIAQKYGIQKSISDSYYNLPGNWKFIFTAVLLGFSIPVMIAGNSTLIFLAGSAICFVSASPAFNKNKLEAIVHVVGAWSGILLGIAGIILDYKLYSIAILAALLSALLYFKAKYFIWWIEIAAFITIWSGVLLYNIEI